MDTSVGYQSSYTYNDSNDDLPMLDLKTGKNTEKQARTSLKSSDDVLVSFNIYSGFAGQPESKNKIPGRWIPKNQTLRIQGRDVSGGYFYYGGVLRSIDGYRIETSLVDDSYPIKTSSIDHIDSSLKYYPSYSQLSSLCRDTYLKWLEGDRTRPSTPIGYVFLYFYGIERRILLDHLIGKKGNNDEFKALFAEIQRLKSIFKDNKSFFWYCTKLLEIMCIYKPGLVSIDNQEMSYGYDSILLKYQISQAAINNKPISSNIALHWLKSLSAYNLKTPARRCSEEFDELFRLVYTQKYGDGILVKPNKSRLSIHYFPASASLSGIRLEALDIPDPSILRGPSNKFISIAEECTNQLDSYSRHLGRKDTSKNDLSAKILLPEILLKSHTTEFIENFKTQVNDVLVKHNGVISVKNFWEIIDEPLPEKINKKVFLFMHSIVDKAGYDMVPNPHLNHGKPIKDGSIVLFNEKLESSYVPTFAYNEILIHLWLGSIIAKQDESIHDNKLEVLKSRIDSENQLTPAEKQSLHAYLMWRLHNTVSFTGLKKHLSVLDPQTKETISQNLIEISLADGKVTKQEITHLEKLFQMLGIDKSLISTKLHNQSTKNGQESSVNTSIATTEHVDGEFKLNNSRLEFHETQTKEIQSLLKTIFTESEEETEEITPDINQEEGILDESHHKFYKQLITQEKWSREEVNKICEDLNLMIDGAIEIINDWSFDTVDSAVIDDDEDIYIDFEIVQELEGK